MKYKTYLAEPFREMIFLQVESVILNQLDFAKVSVFSLLEYNFPFICRDQCWVVFFSSLTWNLLHKAKRTIFDSFPLGRKFPDADRRIIKYRVPSMPKSSIPTKIARATILPTAHR